MNRIELYKDKNLVRTIVVTDSGIYIGLRDYLGPEMPEFDHDLPPVTQELSDVQGRYLLQGGHYVSSSQAPIEQTSILYIQEYSIIIFSIYREEADEVRFYYNTEEKDFDLSGYSTKSKKTLAFVITAARECNLMDLLHMNDSMLREVKAVIETLPMTEVGTEVSNNWYQNLINEGGRFGKDIVAAVITEEGLDQETALKSRFNLIDIYEV